jgi:50S ribosomal protein L16 3-hydroxylase
MVLDALADRDAFVRWIGLHNSLPKYAETDWRPEQPIGQEMVRALLRQSVPLSRNPASRFAFIRGQDGALTLFADGHGFDCAGESAALAEALCAGSSLTVAFEED